MKPGMLQTDRMLIAGRRHLLAVFEDYAALHQHRPHRALNLVPTSSDDLTRATTTDVTTAKIRRYRVLGGLINQYERAAWSSPANSRRRRSKAVTQFWNPTGQMP